MGRQMKRGGNKMEEDIVSAIVQEGEALISGIEEMLGDLFSAIEKEDEGIVSAIKEGGKQMEREGNQMERQEAPVISKRHPGAGWEEAEREGAFPPGFTC